MKNTSYLYDLIDFMREATATPHPKFLNKFGENYIWDTTECTKVEHTINGMSVEDICVICDARFAQGANCQAFVLPDGVVKWESGRGIHDNSDSDTAVRVYNEAVDRGYGDNFARTESFGNITVQERIIPAVDVMQTLPYDHWRDVCSQVEHIGRVMDIGDLHEHNWGFRPDDDAFVTPVIFDYSAIGNRDESHESSRCPSSWNTRSESVPDTW